MKKATTLLLSLLLLIGLAGCEKNEAYALYSKIDKNMQDITSLEMSFDMQAEISSDDDFMSIQMSGITRQVIRSATDVDQEMTMDIHMWMPSYGVDQTSQAVSYYKDGYLYQDVMGMKMKMSMDVAEAVSQGNAQLMLFNDGAILESELIDLGNGKSELYFVLSGEEVSAVLQGFADGFTQGLGASVSSIDYSDVTYVVQVAENELPERIEMEFGASAEIDGSSMDMSYVITMDVISFNSVAAINFPTDLDSYTEY